MNINIRNFNWKTLLSLLVIIAGVIFYIYWGTRYGVWADIGIYAIVIVFLLFGIFGFLLSLTEQKEEKQE